VFSIDIFPLARWQHYSDYYTITGHTGRASSFILARDTRQHDIIILIALYAITRPSVCSTVRHTGGSVKSG